MTTRITAGLLTSFATLLLAQPAAALDADYWRGGGERRSAIRRTSTSS